MDPAVNPVPPVTKYLLWAIGIAYLLQSMTGTLLIEHFALWPLGDYAAGSGADGLPRSVGFQPWQLVSYGFLHGSLFHIFFNALALFQFGARIEATLGSKRFAQYFFVCVIGAGLCQLVVVTMMANSGVGAFPTVGASGGIFGVLLAYGLMYPHERVMMLIPPIPMSARTLVIVFGVIELVAGVTGTLQGIAHFAHLGGMLFGWLLLRYWQGKPPFKKRKPPRPRLVR